MGNQKISDDDVRRIRMWVTEGKATVGEIADRFGVSYQYVLDIAEWRARKSVDPHLNPFIDEQTKKRGSNTRRLNQIFDDRPRRRDLMAE